MKTLKIEVPAGELCKDCMLLDANRESSDRCKYYNVKIWYRCGIGKEVGHLKCDECMEWGKE